MVVLVLNVAEDFLHQVLQRHHTAGAAKLIHHNRHRATLFEQALHHILRKHGFGGEKHRLHLLLPVHIGHEKFAHRNEAEHIVDVVVIHHKLAQTGLGENLHQSVAVGLVDVHRHNLVAWHHTVAQVGVAEVKGVFKDFHLALHLFVLVLALVDGLLQIRIQFLHREAVHLLLVDFHAKHSHQQLREHFGEARERIKNAVEQKQRQRYHAQRRIGVDSKQRLWQKFAGDKDNHGADDGEHQQLQELVFTEHLVNRRTNQARHSHTIHHIHHIIAHKHSGDKHLTIIVKHIDNAVDQPTLLGVDFKSHLICRHKSEFRARKESRQQHSDQHYNKRICRQSIHH